MRQSACLVFTQSRLITMLHSIKAYSVYDRAQGLRPYERKPNLPVLYLPLVRPCSIRVNKKVTRSNVIFFAFLAHLSRRLIGELLVYRGIRRPSVVRRQHFQTTSSLKPMGRFFSYFIYHPVIFLHFLRFLP